MNKKFIITGAPGTGKTSIINELMKQGYACAKEISRELISEQLAVGGKILPWKNQIAFEEKIIQMRFKQYINSLDNCIYFFDRSIIDSIAYLKVSNLSSLSQQMNKLINSCIFNKTVFYTPIWEKIYVTDNERKEGIKKAREIENSIINTYISYGYKMIRIPKVSVKKRTSFILSKI